MSQFVIMYLYSAYCMICVYFITAVEHNNIKL